MSRNAEVAALLWAMERAHALRSDGFRARAYQRAAQAVEALPEAIEEMAAAGRLEDIPGIGPGIRAKVEELLASGKVQALDRLAASTPAGLLPLMELPGLGPKRALRLAQELGVADLAGLQKAVAAGRVRTLPGFGPRSEAALAEELRHHRGGSQRVPFAHAEPHAIALRDALRGLGHPVEIAGSLRRGRDEVGDIDLLAAGSEAAAARLIKAFTAHPRVARVVERGTTRARVRLHGGLGADLRVVPVESFGAAWIYFTGSKAHNIELRNRALARGWSLNEYSLHTSEGRRLAGRTEHSVYRRLGLAWVPPEIREARGELEAAAAGPLPSLVEQADLQGDLHVHTEASDGRDSLEAMAGAAGRRGLAWMGVSDHGETLRIANGLDGSRYAAQRKAIAAWNRKGAAPTLLQGAELDILRDGRLGLDGASRRSLDYVIGSVHGSFRLDRAEQTRRLLAAVHGGIDVLGHPTGRRFPRRAGIDADWEKVFAACADAGVLVEVDGTPDRLDLPGEMAAQARAAGCLFAVDSDAHAVEELALVRYGVVQARRGGLEPRHVVNTRDEDAMRRHLGHGRA